MNLMVEVLNKLMPLGGWSYSEEGGVVVHNDGLAFGYTQPSQDEIDSELVKVENNKPILDELSKLDAFVPRAVEDLIIQANTDSFLVGKANEKKALRSQLL